MAQIRKFIDASDLPESRIAERSGIPISTFRRRYRGVNPWTLTEIESVADALEVRVRDLTDVPDEEVAS